MALSLKLISDSRYNKIEETSQDVTSGANGKNKAWQIAKAEFIDSLYEKYSSKFPSRISQCPELPETKLL